MDISEKKKVLLYGMGNNFTILTSENYWFALVDICAIVDKNKSKEIEHYTWEKKDIAVISPDKMNNYSYDFIIITSTDYYAEIVLELTGRGIDRDKLVSVDEFLAICILESKELNCLRGEGIDIGGPSIRIFGIVYEVTGQCDIVNYSSQNVWSNLEDTFTYKEKVIGNVIVNDATCLDKIQDETYDYVLSSNNLEHIANPLRAVFEWKRILKKNGLMVIVVPCKEFTFDHRRNVVEFSHLVADYENNIEEDDLTHLPEILKLHDLEMDKAAGTYEQFEMRSRKNYENRCLHQHVFDDKVLKEIADYMEMQVLVNSVIYKRNWVIIMRK